MIHEYEAAHGGPQDGMGFNAYDRPRVEHILMAGDYISPAEFTILRRIMPKYAGQIYKIQEANGWKLSRRN